MLIDEMLLLQILHILQIEFTNTTNIYLPLN